MTQPPQPSLPPLSRSPAPSEEVPAAPAVPGTAHAPVVSICSITYNHARFIARALDGFLMQETSFPVEIILNDDCSTDGTAQIIASYQARYPGRITAILQSENQRSKGRMALPIVLERATGKYVAVCEGDDYWTDPRKLQKQVEFLESHPDYAGCCHAVTTETHLPSGKIVHDLVVRSTPIVSLDDLLRGNPIHTCSVVVRREHLPVRLPSRYDACGVGDWPRWALVARHGPWAYLRDPMGVYVIHPSGLWSQLPATGQLKRTILLLAQLWPDMPAAQRPIVHESLFDQSQRFLLASFRTGDAEAPRWLGSILAEQRDRIDPQTWIDFDIQTAAIIALEATRAAESSDHAVALISQMLTHVHGTAVPVRRTRSIVKRAVARSLQQLGNEWQARGDYRPARRLYARSVALHPGNLRSLAYWLLALLGGAGRLLRTGLKLLAGTGRATRTGAGKP